MKRAWIGWGLWAILLFALDFSLKSFAYHSLSYPLTIFKSPIGIDFILQYVTNRGGAWGMLAEFHYPLLFFRIFVVLGLLIYWMRHHRNKQLSFFLVLVIVGAFCNIFDCLYYGYVVDMLHFTFWGKSYGIFNLADSLIFLGALGLVFTLREKHGKQLSHQDKNT